MAERAEFDIEAIEFELVCPKCGHTTSKPAAYIRQYAIYACKGCAEVVPIIERYEILKALAIGEKVIEVAGEIRTAKRVD